MKIYNMKIILLRNKEKSRQSTVFEDIFDRLIGILLMYFYYAKII